MRKELTFDFCVGEVWVISEKKFPADWFRGKKVLARKYLEKKILTQKNISFMAYSARKKILRRCMPGKFYHWRFGRKKRLFQTKSTIFLLPLKSPMIVHKLFQTTSSTLTKINWLKMRRAVKQCNIFRVEKLIIHKTCKVLVEFVNEWQKRDRKEKKSRRTSAISVWVYMARIEGNMFTSPYYGKRRGNIVSQLF